MAITFSNNSIEFGAFTLTGTAGGFEFDGVVKAQGLCSLPTFAQGSVSGYTSGGGVPAFNTIDKFPFTSDTNATDVGNLTICRFLVAGQSSTSSGYTTAGGNPGGRCNTIDKFPFAADGNATDVGDLTVARTCSMGQQV